jgi:hypothetical protein
MARQQQQQQPTQSAQQQAALSEVYELASTHQLGTLQAQYRAKLARLSARAVAILTLIGILGGVSLVGASLLMHGITFAGIVSTLSLLGLVLLCAGLWLAVNALRYYGLRVYVFTEGLVQVKGHKSTVVRWDQVKTMWQKVNVRFISSFYIGTVHAYTLQRDDGKKFTFNDGLRNVQVLGGTLIQEVNSRLLPDVIAKYNAGEHVTFGKLGVSIHGINIGEEIVLWNQVKGVKVEKGALAIYKDGEQLNWPTVKAAKIPNFPLFLALVDYVLKSR